MATSSVGREIWYADNNGFIAGSTVSVDEVTSTIIDTYNEHFGTRISHLTPEAKTYNVGDIIKNWNAYEKIEMPTLYFKTINADVYFIAQVKGNQCFALGDKVLQTVNRVNSEGLCLAMVGGAGIVEGLWVNKLQAAGYNVTGGEIIDSGLSQGDIVPNFDKYVEV